MKFLAALFLSVVSADTAKEQYMNKLVSKAIPRRALNEEYQVNIASYSVKFEQCQFVKAYDEELAQNEESMTVLATKRFAMFRLCPNSCDQCNYNYGEYLIDLETYLESTVQYFQEYQESMCQACEECANNAYANNAYQNADNGGGRFLQNANVQVDCDSCYEECQKIENMEANGYVDATEFLQCQMIYDPEDDNSQPLYAGPICSSGGSRIKIGVFTDEDCLFLDSSKNVDEYLYGDNGQMKLSHALLKSTYTNTCISCKEYVENDYQNANQYQNANNNGQQNDAQDADEVVQMCEELYDAAAKCEKSHGFDDGYSNYYGYENQLAQEEVVCEFMNSLVSGTYDEEGEIIVSGASTSFSNNSTSGGQKFALTFFILGTVALAVYAAMLHAKLVKGGKADLSSSGGAMA